MFLINCLHLHLKIVDLPFHLPEIFLIVRHSCLLAIRYTCLNAYESIFIEKTGQHLSLQTHVTCGCGRGRQSTYCTSAQHTHTRA
jgi:hypothetical protein